MAGPTQTEPADKKQTGVGQDPREPRVYPTEGRGSATQVLFTGKGK